MYRDVYHHFIEDNKDLFKDIEKYVNQLNPEFTNLVCKKFIKNDQYDLMGEMDLVNIDQNKIIDFKCSSADSFKLDWLLQLLAYTAIMKKSYQEYDIKNVEIYNPLQGCIYTIDLSDWDKEDEYLSYLYEIRVRQLTRNINSLTVNTDEEYPINYSTCNSLELPDYKKKEYIFDLQKIYGPGYDEYLEYMKINANDKYKPLIEKFEKYSHKRYIVLDTETIGLPKKEKYGGLPIYSDIKKYDDARMIQICWAVYCDNKLEKLCDYYVKPKGFKINNTHIHGITEEKCYKKGYNINQVLTEFSKDLASIDYIVGHNINFDYNIICSELYRSKFHKIIDMIQEKTMICTMRESISLKVDGTLKATKLVKLYKYLFGKEFEKQHNAKYDVLATADIFKELVKRKIILL